MPRGEKGTSRCYRRGKIWWIRYTVNGAEKRESSKSDNKAEATKLLNKRRSENDAGKIISGDVTIGNLLDLYVSANKKRRNTGPGAVLVETHLRPAFGKIRATEATTAMLNRFTETKLTAGYANAYVNRMLEALKRSFALGIENTPPLVTTAPKFKMLDESGNVREGFLTHPEYIAMRDQLPAHQKLILVIGYHLGMRRGEILGLRWDQVDWDAGLIRLAAKQTKAKTARVAPLYGELRSWLEMAFQEYSQDKDQKRSSEIVSWKGHAIQEIRTAWDKARERAGVPELLLHDLRRTAVRNMTRAGIPEQQAMLISGHKTRSMFQRYNIVDERDIQMAGQKLDIYLTGQVKPAAEVAAVQTDGRVN